ncbi:hypothetical protein J6590_093696 [Homalodisca vitripennis]|nr:hypothetical protein J6590_093696 [Homalodisca vitripennis]
MAEKLITMLVVVTRCYNIFNVIQVLMAPSGETDNTDTDVLTFCQKSTVRFYKDEIERHLLGSGLIVHEPRVSLYRNYDRTDSPGAEKRNPDNSVKPSKQGCHSCVCDNDVSMYLQRSCDLGQPVMEECHSCVYVITEIMRPGPACDAELLCRTATPVSVTMKSLCNYRDHVTRASL